MRCINIPAVFINMQREIVILPVWKKITRGCILTISFFVPLHHARRKQRNIEEFVSAICKQIHDSGAAICRLDRVVR